jgi:hypothetical protein
VQELRDHEVGDLVVDGLAEEDDPLVEQPRVDVVLALAAGGALDDHGDEGHDKESSPSPRSVAQRLTDCIIASG